MSIDDQSYLTILTNQHLYFPTNSVVTYLPKQECLSSEKIKSLRPLKFRVRAENSPTLSTDKLKQLLTNYQLKTCVITGYEFSNTIFFSTLSKLNAISLSELRLYGCYFGSKTIVKSLGELIEKATYLKTLVLCGCKLDDPDATTLLNKIIQNNSLFFANLSCNNITNKAFYSPSITNKFDKLGKKIIDLTGNISDFETYSRINSMIYSQQIDNNYDFPLCYQPQRGQTTGCWRLNTDSNFWKNLSLKNKIEMLLAFHKLLEQQFTPEPIPMEIKTCIQTVIQDLCKTGTIKSIHLVPLLRLISLLMKLDVMKKQKNWISPNIDSVLVTAFLDQLDKMPPLIIKKVLSRTRNLKIHHSVILNLIDVVMKGGVIINNTLLVNIFYLLAYAPSTRQKVIPFALITRLQTRINTLRSWA